MLIRKGKSGSSRRKEKSREGAVREEKGFEKCGATTQNKRSRPAKDRTVTRNRRGK